ncbi:MAG: RtcB family protein, partial [Halobacteriota archaeon]
TFDADGIELTQIDDYIWEIEAEGEMRVPARVMASEALLEEIMEDKTLQQITNVTHLPGIQSPAVCMPDGHQGYGFPVGGVAATDAESGVISPGGVGYDINCLTGDSEIQLSFGRHRPIESLETDFAEESVRVIDDSPVDASIQLFTESEKTVYEITTKAGDVVRASGDHPFRTDDGMVPLRELQPGDVVSVHPFEGLPDTPPSAETILTVEDFDGEDPQLVRALEQRDLLPLTTDDEAFNRLLKLVAFHTGDGSFSGSQTWFYGDPEDLEDIREDIDALGFTPSRIYERERSHEIDGNRFERTEYSVRATANSFRALLVRLGAPTGQKVKSTFTTPAYLDKLTDWQKALYLSAFFGAEMSAPDTVAAKNFYAPSVSHNRLETVESAGETFLEELKTILESLDIRTNELEVVERRDRNTGRSVRFRFGISSEATNLIRFFTTVGYRYNQDKQRRGLQAAQYLRVKDRVISERATIANRAKTMADGGVGVTEIAATLDGVNRRFIERSIYDQRDGRPRPPETFPDFDRFADTHPVEDDMTIRAEIESIQEVGEESVYDIGVDHDAHNFVANGFVVSNCGVRMVKTNLTYADVQGHEQELVDALFEAVPSGLGGGGVVEGTTSTVNEILDRGMRWALDNGYAVEDDLEHCEDNGFREEADPSMVSDEAKNRGRKQIGSLGSGNHFLEVQRVTDVYREDVADAFGLTEGQIVVLIHCGSRGLGHQVCTDYLRRIEQDHGDLLASLPDRELAAAPAGSQLAEEYYGAMNAAINYAWVNRQLVMHQTRQVFADVFDTDWRDLDMDLLYDVAHNIAKKETHEVAGEQKELYVHRKGATRAFPAGHPDVPEAYRDVGQPVIIPGSMGAGSYVLRGGENSMDLTFGSTAHGAGRLMSRTQAKKDFWGGDVQDELRDEHQIYVKAQSGATIAEEAPGVYKDVDEVVRVSDELGIGDTVARTYPVVNIKG